MRKIADILTFPLGGDLTTLDLAQIIFKQIQPLSTLNC